MNGTATTCSSATASGCSAHTSSIVAATRRWGPPGATSTSRPSAVRRLGRTRHRVTPRPPPYKWWNWHDSYDAEALPDPKWVEVSDAGEAAFRKRDAGE